MSENKDRKDVLRQALVAIESLEAKLAAARKAANEPIAIVGMACRLPGGIEDPEAYWKLLSEGTDAVREIPADRWDVDAFYDADPAAPGKMRTRRGGFLDQVDQFDPGFFGISPREATSLDPQQRLLLELSWEALERAGIAPESLEGSRTGVFVGITTVDYAKRIDFRDPARSDVYVATGNALNAAAGRVSFTLGLQGPCAAMDTACSSSLVAVHTACQSLRTGESSLAFAGGVNVILTPDAHILFSKWGMVAPDGRVKAFDASADGFVRGEGCGVLLLERLSDARANNHPVLAVIRGSASNSDGRSSGLTVPNGLAQQAVIRQALGLAQMKPTEVQYVEAHGTGTSLGDPIEVEALAAVYGEGRQPTQPLEIGSVKSNLGHLESASGVTGLMKLVLSLQNRSIPASLHLQKPSPAIPWDRIPVRVSTALHAWPSAAGARVGAVSSFGFSGTNAHVIVEEAPADVAAVAAKSTPRSVEVLPLSAKSEAALAALAGRYAAYLEKHESVSVADMCHTARIGRSHFAHRLAIVAKDRAGLIEALKQAARGESPTTLSRGTVTGSNRMKVAFLFTGQGAQYVGMGKELYASEPVFREAVDRCAQALEGVLDRDLRTVMFEESGGPLDQTQYTQPALYALEVGMARLWQSWGVEPTVVLGHSVGEYAAACIAGAYEIEVGARLIAERGRRMQALPGSGAMLAIQGEETEVERVSTELLKNEPDVSIAARNAPGSIVLSGARSAIERLEKNFQSRGLMAQRLVVSHGFHSSQMEPMLSEYERSAQALHYQPPKVQWISNLTGEALKWNEWSGRMGEYWRRHVREPVQFARGIKTAAQQGVEVFLEVGPHPVLSGLGRATLKSQTNLTWSPSLARGAGATERLLMSLAQLYAKGVRIDWRAFDRDRGQRIVSLPTYPFQRQRYWLEESTTRVRLAGPGVHPLLGERRNSAVMSACFERALTCTDPAFLADHRIGGQVVMPMTAYLEIALAAGRIALERNALDVVDLNLDAPMIFADGVERVMQVIVDTADTAGAHRVRVFSRVASAAASAPWTLHATANVVEQRAEHEAQEARTSSPRATAGKSTTTGNAVTAGSVVAIGSAVIAGSGVTTGAAVAAGKPVDAATLYSKLRSLGVEFGPSFLGLQTVTRSADNGTVGRVASPPSIRADAARYLSHPAMLDACLHVAALAVDDGTRTDERIYLPVGIDRFTLLQAFPAEVIGTAHVREGDGGGELIRLDVDVRTESGEPVARLEGVRCRLVSRDVFAGNVTNRSERLTYEINWRAFDLPTALPAATRGTWIVLADSHGACETLTNELVARGDSVVRVTPGTSYRVIREDSVQINPQRADDYTRLLSDVAGRAPLKGVVDLWALRMPALTATNAPGEMQTLGAGAALLLVQACAKQATSTQLRLCLVTHGSQATRAGERVRAEHAPLWGFGKVAVLEHPELRTTLIDLDGAGPATRDVAPLIAVILGATDEPQVAFREGRTLSPRLAESPADKSSVSDKAVCHADAAYLVTGGLGALGLLTARWLVEQGAKHVTLVGRNAPADAALETIDALRATGAEISAVQADLATRAGVDGLIASFANGKLPLKGIVHCAGVLADNVIAQQNTESLARVMGPKADAAWYLHTRIQATGTPLDFFVLFSSMSAVMGAAGQANYVAANSFLDALAADRLAQGLPALSIGWGSWEGSGMAARAQVIERFAAQGIRSLKADEAFTAMAALLERGVAHAAVAPIDWAALRARMGGARGARLLEDLLGKTASETADATDSPAVEMRLALARLDRPARLTKLRGIVQEAVGMVLGLRRGDGALTDDQSFASLGLDSLTAVELRNALHARLGVRLEPTVGFEHPTLAALAVHLDELLQAASAHATVDATADVGEREEVTL